MGRTIFQGSAVAFVAALAFAVTNAAASEIDDVKAADQAFHVALSTMDAKAMAGLWANKPNVTNIGPNSTAVLVGYADAVTNWISTVVPSRFSELKSEMTSIASIEVNGNVAWVVGTEHATGKTKAGEPLAFDALVTNLYEKQDGKWLMVSHHAQRPPK